MGGWSRASALAVVAMTLVAVVSPADVRAQNGERREIPEHAHLHQDYVKAFGAAGLRVRRLLEPALTPSQARARARLGRQDLYEQALTGIPAVIVWEVERE